MIQSQPQADLEQLLEHALATGGETARFDFKELLDFASNGEHKLKLLKAIGAFCNTDHGGCLIIGISDDRRVVGVPPAVIATYDQTRVHRMVSEWFAPAPTFQVRHHRRDGKLLVVIEVEGFAEVPSVVRRTDTQGAEKLQAGTFLTRTGAAESAMLRSETDVRALCDAITARRTRQIVEAVRNFQATQTAPEDPKRRVVDALTLVRAEADRMAKHAQALNIELHHSRGKQSSRMQYLPLLFRPALLESSLTTVLSALASEGMVMDQLSVLRTAAAAADERTAQIMARGGDARPLIDLVLQVMNAARFVSDVIGRKLAQLTPKS
jgi:hypothetical protein